MASKKVYIDIIVDDKGSTKRVAVDAKRLGVALEDSAGATERVNKANESYSKSTSRANRQTRGLAGTASSTGKTLGNLASGIQGGLVPAYATLAAHVFAITALFDAFSRAADTTKLIAGQEALAANTGVAYRTVSNSIKEATGAQLSFKDAASAAAIGTAAGLSPVQLEKLGKAAKDTSFLLGRDLTDSFNRLVRGVTKAEPELLDELGIILRLEPATKKYADSINKSVSELSAYERSQAVANEVLSQAETKFGSAADGADNAGESVARLKSSFDSLMEVAQTTIIKTLAPAFDFLTENTKALTVASGVLGLGFIKAFTPAGPQLANIGAAADKARARIKDLALAGGKSKLGDAIAGGARIGASEIAQLERSANSASSTVIDMSRTNKDVLKADLGTLKLDHDVQMSKMSKGWKGYFASAKANMKGTIDESGKFLGGLRIFGAGASRILSAIPFLGMAYLAFEALTAYKESLNGMTAAQKAAEKATNSFAGSMKTLGEEIQSTLDKMYVGTNTLRQTATAMGNIALSANILNKIDAFERLGKDTNKYKEAQEGLVAVFEKLADMDPRYGKFVETIRKGNKLSDEQRNAIHEINNELITGSQAIQRWADTYNNIIESIRNVSGGESATPLDLLIQNTDRGLARHDESMVAMENASQVHQDGLDHQNSILDERFESMKETLDAVNALGKRPVSMEDEPLLYAADENNPMRAVFKAADAAVAAAKAAYDEQSDFVEKLAKERSKYSDEEMAKEKEKREELERYKEIYGRFQTKLLSNQEKSKENDKHIAVLSNLGLNLYGKIANIRKGALVDENAMLAATSKKIDAEARLEAIKDKIKDDTDANVIAAQRELDLQRDNVAVLEIAHDLNASGRAMREGGAIRADKDLKASRKGLSVQKELNYELEREERIRAGMLRGVSGDRAEFEARQARIRSARLELERAEIEFRRAQENKTEVLRYNPEVPIGEGARDAAIKRAKDAVKARRAAERDLAVEESILTIQRNQTALREEELRHQLASVGLNPLQEAYYLKTREHIKVHGYLMEGTAKRLEEEVKLEYTLNEQLELKSTLYNTMEDSFSSFFASFSQGTSSATDAFKAMAKDILAQLAQLMARMLATKILMMSFGVSKAPDVAHAVPKGLASGNYGESIANTRLPRIDQLKSPFREENRYGGIVDPPKYSMGGVARGRQSGYPAVLHGTEAVVPLPNNREIPVDLKGGSGTNNVVVNVSMEGQSSSRDVQGDQQLKSLGTVISSAVQGEIQRQKRPGGLLSPYGAA